MPELLNNFLAEGASFSYAGIFILAFLSGYLIPLPEEVALLYIGYIAGISPVKLPLALVVAVCGVLLGDNLLYYLSYRGSAYAEKIRHKLKNSRISRYEKLMQRHIGKAIFFLRFIVGFRSFGPVLAGSIKVSWRRFFTLNLAASLLHAAGFVLLGFFYRSRFLVLVSEVEIVRHILFLSSALIFSLLIWLYLKLRQFRQGEGIW